MRFDMVIKNGTVVTATDTCVADIGVSGHKVSAIGAQLPIENAGKVVDAAGCLVIPGGIDVHTHLDMPFGGTMSADDFETGTIAAAFGGTTTLIDFAIQYKGQSLREAFDTWMKKAHDKAVTDYSFHCIITDLGSAQLEEMGQLIREGVTSFKLFMAYPGVFMLDDASIFRAMSQAARKTRAKISCAHAAGHRGSRSHLARDCACRNGGRARVHRPSFLQRGARESSRSARPRPARIRRNLSAVFVSLARKFRRARL